MAGLKSLIPGILILYGTTCCTSEIITNAERINSLTLEVLPEATFPSENQQSDLKIALGKNLFWDPILSGQKDVACVTCHLPSYGYADGLDLSIGVGGVGSGVLRTQPDLTIPRAPRNAPTILNSAFNGLLNSNQDYDPLNGIMFWDGRKKSLEAQCIGPLASFNTMRGNAYAAAVANDSIIKRLKAIPEYVALFDEVFGSAEAITIENLGRAIASFERSLISDNSLYDQYVKGNKEALSLQQQEGLLLFFGKANCSACHSGPMFSDFNFYNLGIPFNNKVPADSGKNKAFLFRTPTLRNVSITAPYMHNGIFLTLDEVIDHYVKASSQNESILHIDKKITPLRLSENEKRALISFLEALTDDNYDQTKPLTVPSGLNPGGNL